MSFEKLLAILSTTNWFENLGLPSSHLVVQIDSLAPWANLKTEDDSLKAVLDQMRWLPSSKDETDPVNGNAHEELVVALGKKKEYVELNLSFYKAALQSLGAVQDCPKLIVGPHDFIEAAKGAALYATRRACLEIFLGCPGFWCELMKIYADGHWPCGILSDNRIVVF